MRVVPFEPRAASCVIWDGAGLAFVQALGGRQFAIVSGVALAFAVGSTVLVLAGELARSRFKAAP